MVCMQGGDNMFFHANSKGLHLIEYNVSLFAFIETMTENMKGYSAGQINGLTCQQLIYCFISFKKKIETFIKVKDPILKRKMC